MCAGIFDFIISLSLKWNSCKQRCYRLVSCGEPFHFLLQPLALQRRAHTHNLFRLSACDNGNSIEIGFLKNFVRRNLAVPKRKGHMLTTPFTSKDIFFGHVRWGGPELGSSHCKLGGGWSKCFPDFENNTEQSE